MVSTKMSNNREEDLEMRCATMEDESSAIWFPELVDGYLMTLASQP